MIDFANILFGGPCNRSCPFCIGKSLPARVATSNLNRYPLRNLDRFVNEVNLHQVKHVVLTGTTTDPQLYRHEARLLKELKGRVETGADYSLHTNGVLALKKLETFNLYDKVCLSFPSFDPTTYGKLMGVSKPPDLARIVERAIPELKVSCIVTQANCQEIPDFLRRCADLGIPRLVFRRLYGKSCSLRLPANLTLVGEYRNNPVYDFRGMEVTVWSFGDSTSTSLNLFADGTLGRSYLLTQTDFERAG
jgi:MoaA/NifB/PqqE/SkfB family radical SAM enzyme